MTHQADSVLSRTLARFKRWFWHPPRAHGDTILERRVTPLESLYDLVYAAVISQAAHPLEQHVSARRILEFAVVFALIWIAWTNGSRYLELHGREDGRTPVYQSLPSVDFVRVSCPFVLLLVQTCGGLGIPRVLPQYGMEYAAAIDGATHANPIGKEYTMRVFVAGASGAIGTRLVPQLIDHGHEVIGTFRSPGNAERVRALGAEPIALDLLDAPAVREAVLAAEPEAIVHEATALANLRLSRNFDRSFAQTNRLRTEGTDALLAAAREAGVRRFVAQSFASMRYAHEGGMVKTEDDPLDPSPPKGARESSAAMAYLDQTVTEAGGIALRYGGFYGASNDGLIEPVRKRQFPIVGDGGGVSSFIHLDDAAAATVLALEHEGPAIYNIVDDEPAPVREWLPVLAKVLGAKPPRHFPVWLARLFAGEAAVMIGTESRGASNARAKRELGWTLRYPSWREGFVAAYASTSTTDGRESHPAARRSRLPT